MSRRTIGKLEGFRWIPVFGAVLTILAQILWPLTSGNSRVSLTIATVLIFAATSISHAWIHHGWRWAASYTAITFVFALTLEAVGTNTGFPFSAYEYTGSLGPRLFDVPLLIAAAWTMMAYPVLLVSRRLAMAISPRLHTPLAIAIGAFSLTAWDLFLDPQMVSAGYWTWADATTDLVGVPGIPAINYLGWFVSSLLLMSMLAALPGGSSPEGVPATLWVWTWVGGIIANAFFFDRPSVALVGGVAMGLVTVPYLILLLRQRKEAID
jgi:putative membrane protein